MKRDNIGIFGGTFDPFHNAHLSLARQFCKNLHLSALRLIPAGQPYHREQRNLSAAQHRLAMLKLAVEHEPTMFVDTREITRVGPSYTVDTLEELRNEFGWHCPFWLLVGSDAFATLTRWKAWQHLFDLANLVVAWRPSDCVTSLPLEIQAEWKQRYRELSTAHDAPFSGTIHTLPIPPMNLSATMIRTRYARGEDISPYVTPAVLRYIREHQLYLI